MPNMIRRAGPFASNASSFLDEPESAVSSVIPVNCAKDGTANWPWRYFVYAKNHSNIGTVSEYRQGAIDVSINAPNDGSIEEATLYIIAKFCYQSCVPFSFGAGSLITIEWSASESNVGWYYQIKGTSDGTVSDEAIVDGHSSEHINISDLIFPASVVPRVVEVSIFMNSDLAEDMFGRVLINLE